MGVSILIFGMIITFFGRKLIRIIVFLAGVLVGMTGCLVLYFIIWYDPADQAEWAVYLTFTVGLIVGILVGYLLARSVRLAQAIVAAYMGFSIAMLINGLVLYLLESETVFWVTVTLFSLGFAILGCVCHSKHMCWITALAGAYISIRGLALCTGHFQN